MNWPQLLNWNRLGDAALIPIDPSRSPWQYDYDRIVFSSAFRRLQDKTQVFPLSGGGDYVRTRLTHSLEVSTVARSLGMQAGKAILERHGDELIEPDPRSAPGKFRPMRDVFTPADIGAIVANAALAHDVGNPPFGHSGEDAVRHWFRTSAVAQRARDQLAATGDEADFSNWEGNAQGFRILTRHELYPDSGGFRLTYATLAAFTKYPTSARSLLIAKKARLLSQKKNGYFESEAELFAQVAQATGLIHREQPGVWCRHPLAFLMEAADDICYRIVDLEDGHRLGRIPYAEAVAALRLIATNVSEKRLAVQANDGARIAYLRARAIGQLANQVSEEFAKHDHEILRGEYERELISGADCFAGLKQVQKLVRDYVYPASSVVETEAVGFEVIPGLLDIFWHAVDATAEGCANLRDEKIMQVLQSSGLGTAAAPTASVQERLMGVIDIVTGMTDSNALSFYRKLKGIDLPR